MVHSVEAGTILIREGLLLPKALNVTSERYSDHWRTLSSLSRTRLDDKIRAAGWNFFSLAARISSIALGLNGIKTTGSALKRLLAKARSQDFNSLEVTAISSSHFLGVPYTTVSAHSRHIQEGAILASPLERKRIRKATEWATGNGDRTRLV